MEQKNNFEAFAKQLIPSRDTVDPETLRKAKVWYKQFAGAHAVTMNDRELVEIYSELN
jgi:hypothetical protein